MLRKTFLLVLSFSMVWGISSVVAETGTNYWYDEGTYLDEGGNCMQYRVLSNYVYGSGGTPTHVRVQVFTGPCGGCLTSIFDATLPVGFLSFNVDGVPVEGDGSSGWFPVSVNSSGVGYVTVASGNGGALSPSGSPSCEMDFLPDQSSVLTIAAVFLAP